MRHRFLLATLAALLLSRTARAEGLESQLLSVGDAEVRAVRASDLTGDGVLEIVAFADAPDGIRVAVFVPDGSGRYPPEPTVRLHPADSGLSEVYYAAAVRLGRDRPAEILFVDRKRGILTVGIVRGEDGAWRAEPFRERGIAPPLPFPPAGDRITVLDVGADLDGDGGEELLLPAQEGYRIYRETKEGLLETARVAAAASLAAGNEAHRFLTLRWDLPRLTVADWDGDGLPDLVGGHRGQLLLHLQTREGTWFAVTQALHALGEDPEAPERSDLVLGDVNGDGRLDLVVGSHAARVGPLDRFTSRWSLFLNPRIFSLEDEGALSTPAGSFVLPGVGVNPTLLDYDRDGDLDLLVTVLDVTPGSRLRREVDAEYLLYLFDGKSRSFETSPYFRITRPFPVEQLERGSTDPVCFFSGDFDGDGRKDLLDIADGGRISIRSGTSDTGLLSAARYAFEDDPVFTADFGVSNDVLVVRLGLRAADDAVAFRGGRIHVIRRAR